LIGVISKDSEVAAVQEFFQLFKTPWERFAPEHEYDLVIATSADIPKKLTSRALAIYSSAHVELDGALGIVQNSREESKCLQWGDIEFPVYCGVSVSHAYGKPLIHLKEGHGVVGLQVENSSGPIFRIGYDLFEEVSFLLSKGQPAQNSHIPTLDIHISFLRECMLRAALGFVEILPVPAGYDFMACLTHDVDFIGIRDHKCDSTMWGFVYRALVGSFLDALRTRMAWSKCLCNWKAVLSLPLVYLGLRDDFWLEFDRYMQIERELGSTFFFIPFRNSAGTWESRPAPKRRAAKYDLTDVKKQVLELETNGCEVGLHGIDAWQNPRKARAELRRIRDVTEQRELGVRMHWLYWAEASPKALEEAGFAYDSTSGYNDAVGFRAGTTQVFCSVGAKTLLELPLNIQDTALFYRGRLNLSETEAMGLCRHVIRQAAKFHGALTVNWHTRSLSPERLWGDFYQRLLGEIRNYRVWFGTGQQVVNWFRIRRALRFEQALFAEDGLHLKIAGPSLDGRLPFVVRIRYPRPCTSGRSSIASTTCDYSDIPWKGEAELTLVQ
jgi:hypothetical protein